MRAQAQMLFRSPQLFATLLVIPFYSLVFFHFLKSHHQGGLATTTAITAFLMGSWSHAVFVASQAVDDDRVQGTLNLSLLTPSRYLLALATRTLVTCSLALPVLGEMFLVGRWVFGLPIRVDRPGLTVLVAVLVTTGVAATALLMSGLMILVRAARSLQNALTYPFYLLGGLILPITTLPEPLRWVSRAFFLSWGAQLLRDAAAGQVPDPGARLGVLCALVGLQAALGLWTVRRVLTFVRSGRVVLNG
ncbi:ABC transporter permease [Streptomyces sp. NPDC051452]|uniref:ABC transporter permease n=1 Tax=Streptomyces sp. NPDC051452 TaxID=3365654 RepID=UPI0037A0F151